MKKPKLTGDKLFKYFFAIWQENFDKFRFAANPNLEDDIKEQAQMEATEQYVAIIQERFGDSWDNIFLEKNTPQQTFEYTCAFLGEFLEEMAISKSYESISKPEKAKDNAVFAAGVIFAGGKISEMPEAINSLFDFNLRQAQERAKMQEEQASN